MGDSMDYEDSCNGDPGDVPKVDLIHRDNETGENWLVYNAGETEGNFDDWLERHTPSRINKHRHNVDWISVSRPREIREDLDLNVAGMLDAWDQLLSTSGRPRNEKTVVELAKNFGVTSGKWLFFVNCGGKADHLWNIVAKGIISGQLTCDSAKISVMDEEDDEHAICMYNPDFTDKDQVIEAESSIRKLGIKCCMQYKPDAYTYLGIYGGNPWGMYPYILKSNFDIGKGVSIITDHFSY